MVARIANLRPDIVLVERNVSRLAQELLLALKMTLVLNVKASVLERVKRCTRAEIVTSVDAHIEPPQLGSCKSFYLRTFHNDKGKYPSCYRYQFVTQYITYLNIWGALSRTDWCWFELLVGADLLPSTGFKMNFLVK